MNDPFADLPKGDYAGLYRHRQNRISWLRQAGVVFLIGLVVLVCKFEGDAKARLHENGCDSGPVFSLSHRDEIMASWKGRTKSRELFLFPEYIPVVDLPKDIEPLASLSGSLKNFNIFGLRKMMPIVNGAPAVFGPRGHCKTAQGSWQYREGEVCGKWIWEESNNSSEFHFMRRGQSVILKNKQTYEIFCRVNIPERSGRYGNVGSQLVLGGFFSFLHQTSSREPQEKRSSCQGKSEKCKGDCSSGGNSLWRPIDRLEPANPPSNSRHPFPLNAASVGLLLAVILTLIGIFFAWILNR